METFTKREKIIWNQAIRMAANEAYLYDGLIPNERDRKAMKSGIVDKLSYKIKTSQNEKIK